MRAQATIVLPFPPAGLSGHAKGHRRSKAALTAKHRAWAREATLAAHEATVTGALVEIRINEREIPRRLALDKGLRDAVADHLRHRWPVGTAKEAARTYDLTLDRAREAVAGRASLTTLEAIFKRGGWPVALAILADVIGHGIAQHIAELRARHEDHGKRLAALFGDFGAGGRGGAGRSFRAGRLAADGDDAPARGVGGV